MANEIQQAFNAVYADGPPSNPTKPNKSLIRQQIGGTIQAQFDALATAAGGKWVPFSTKAAMDATLGYAADVEARVYNDGVNDGVYKKVGATGSGSWTYVGPLPEADTTELTQEVDDLTGVVRADLLPSPARKSGLSLEWLDVLLGDQEGDVYAGFDQYGSLRAQLQDAPGIPVISADYAYIFTLEDGTLVFAIDWDGNLVTGADARDLKAFAYTVGGVSRVVAVRTSGESSDITFGENNAYGPSISGGYIHYVESEGGSFNVKREEGLALTSLLPSVGSVQCVFVYGQSLSVGRSSSPAVSTAPVLPGRAVMFNGGSFVRGPADDTGALTDDRIRSWVDMYETRTGENPGNQLGLYLANERPADEGVLVAALGVGGQPYASLKKGTQPYANLLMAVRRARIIAGLNGLDFLPPVMTWDQGQSDVVASLVQYLGYLVELQADVTSDWARYSGSSGEVVIFVDQMSNWTKYSITTCEVPLAQLQSALDLPAKFACVGPQYMLDYIDGIHLTGQSSARMGAYQGRAIAQHLSGVPWEPLHIASAIRTGANIVLTYAGGDETTDILIDTTLVSNPGNFGFEWKQTGGTARTISSVTKTGTRQITVALSGDPGAPSASSIGYAVTGVSGANAGPTTGARGNIRDQSPDLTPLGAPMHNWACHQIINL